MKNTQIFTFQLAFHNRYHIIFNCEASNYWNAIQKARAHGEFHDASGFYGLYLIKVDGFSISNDWFNFPFTEHDNILYYGKNVAFF